MSRVEAFAALCLPDFVYTRSETRDAAFIELDLASHTGDDVRPHKTAGLSVLEDGKKFPHFFTMWSRSQLLSHLGTREKWFNRVRLSQQVSELNVRMVALENYVIRTMRSFDDPDLRAVRGIVSSRYADIPDTDIMKALSQLLPNGYAVRGYSGKTDRAMYAYVVTGELISIPNTHFVGLPGVVVKNSEVGYTSLWVIPMIFTIGRANTAIPMVLEKHRLLRRIHRGSVTDLADKFKEALNSAKTIWGPMEAKIRALIAITYIDENEAVDNMTRMLRVAKAQEVFIATCDRFYRGEKHGVHTALGILEAVLAGVSDDNQDTSYSNAAVAGAVLLSLLR